MRKNIRIPGETVDWLCNSDIPRVRFKAGALFGRGYEDRKFLYTDPLVRRLIGSLDDWETEVLKQHNKPDLAMHRLGLLADSGVRAGDDEILPVIERVLSSFEDDSIPRINILLPTVFGGSGEVERVWIICDYPQILYALLKMGVRNKTTLGSLAFLAGLGGENGYHCTSSMEGFKGPGKKTDTCPVACLYALKALNQEKATRSSEPAKAAAGFLLRHWEDRGKKKYFLFGIGTDYGKLKYPMVWYNLLHVMSVISESDVKVKDPRVLEMAGILLDKADDNMRFTAGSMYRYYKEEDFADKKNPSPTITLAALEILMRLGLAVP